MRRQEQRRALASTVVIGMIALVCAGVFATPSAAAPTHVQRSAAVSYRCQIDVYGKSATGRIKFRRVVNDRVRATRTSARAVRWAPLAWGLTSVESWPGHEITRQLVPSADGRIRYVETEWLGSGGLRVSVLRVVGSGFPHRLVAAAGRTLYWLTADGVLHRSTWTGRRITPARVLPVTIAGATAITAWEDADGLRLVYVTDRAGALHVVADGTAATVHVLRARGFAGATGIKAGDCMSPDYVWVRDFVGVVVVDRTSGVARFVRHLHPGAAAGGTLTTPVRVPPADWTWRRAG